MCGSNQALVVSSSRASTSAVPVRDLTVPFPDYWADACRQLARRDRVMKRLIPLHAHTGLQSRGDAFSTLARSIIGQQISVKAAQSVWNRFEATCVEMLPQRVLALPTEQLRAAGLSARKADYLHDLALHFAEDRLHPAAWQEMDDEAIISELVQIRGIGRWTAEMFLMFYLLRPNVLPLDDAGLVKGISQNYFSGEPVSRSDMREVAEAWKPWCSVATWFIWRSLEPVPVAY
ncbi:DNA-3-methyladenine glycosylase [Brachymonas chironomi]|uniref:DNA-3-methyladenine glycosylase family protein n=1 Tax=Brachymonas chironomi TaxID=491919 RepID=UPI0003780312